MLTPISPIYHSNLISYEQNNKEQQKKNQRQKIDNKQKTFQETLDETIEKFSQKQEKNNEDIESSENMTLEEMLVMRGYNSGIKKLNIKNIKENEGLEK